MGEPRIDASGVEAVRTSLDAAAGLSPLDALPHLREAVERLTDLLDETMAAAVLSDQASLRAAGAQAGLTENAVGPRLARTRRLAAYADERGRVTAATLQRARYDLEAGTPRPSSETTAMRFKPRRQT